MTSLFDGIGALLADTFGAPVTILPTTGGSYTVTGIYRTEPVEVADEGGQPVLVVAPTLKVRKDEAPSIAPGDSVEPSEAPGLRYQVQNTLPSGSPASDSFILCELMLLEGGG